MSFLVVKNLKFHQKYLDIFLIFAPKHRLWVRQFYTKAVLMSTHNLCFGAKIRKYQGGSNKYPQSMFCSKNKKK